MTHKVTITLNHCIGSDYSNHKGCPLYKAIKEQMPEFGLEDVAGSFLMANNKNYIFNADLGTGWNWDTMQDILDGKIDSYTVEFSSME